MSLRLSALLKPGNDLVRSCQACATKVFEQCSASGARSDSQQFARWASTTSDAAASPATASVITFPQEGIILGRARPSARHKAAERALHKAQCRVFDNHDGNNLRSGRKRMKELIKGPQILNWYLPKIRDPLLVDMDGQAKLQDLALARARGDIAPKKTAAKAAPVTATKKKKGK